MSNHETADHTYLQAIAGAQGAPGPATTEASTPSAESTTPMSEEDQDAVLSEIEERAGIKDDDEDFQFEEDGDGQEEDGGHEEDAPAAQAAPEAQDDTEAYAQALALLTAAGWSTKDILALDRSVAIKTGEVMAKRQAPPANEQQQTEEVLPGSPQKGSSAVDFGALRDTLSVDLGEEGSAALVAALEQIATASRPDPRVEALQRSQEGLRRMMLQREVNHARSSLATDFPGLSDDDVYARVIARADRLADGGGYDDVETAMRHACMIELPQPAKPKDGADRSRKKQGQPSRPGRRGPKGPSSEGEIYDAILNDLEDPNRRLDPNSLAVKYFGG